jgi:hypothetical protein
MNKKAAQKSIASVFNTYKGIRKSHLNVLKALSSGKLYELYVLGRILEELRHRGFKITFVGTTIQFKSAPGKIEPTSPHFEVFAPGSTAPDFRVFTDIEFKTYGSRPTHNVGASSYHEIDIAVVTADASDRPRYDQIALGVECKAFAKFRKSIVKEALGIRRELSLLSGMQASILSRFPGVQQELVPANPPSEYWLAHLDPAGTGYQASPSSFGIRFENWIP